MSISARQRQQSQQPMDDDDVMSYCGSISGETFSSRRRRNTCSLRQHSIDTLAKRLRKHHFDAVEGNGSICEHPETKKKVRCNTFFHHFRILVIMMGGFSVGTMFLLRYNITVSILRMVNQTHLYMEEHPDRTIEDFLAAGYSPGGEFNWNNEIQHMIMSWYMVAYTLPQVPSTKLGNMLGSRLAVPISLTICGVSTLLTPMFAYWGWQWVIVLRLLNGLGASAVLPMLLTLVENWMPYSEISLGLSVAQTLTAVLSATNPLLAGYLSAIHWSYSFYVPGICTLVFCVLWLIFITDRPEDNFFISERELSHICDCKDPHEEQVVPKKEASPKDGDDDDDSQYKPDSWVQMLKGPTLYAYIIIWCFYCSSYSGFNFVLPTYLRQFLKIKVAQNGMYCSIIQTGCILAAMWPHPVLKILQNNLGFSQTASRRITQTLLCSVVALSWIYVGLFHDLQLLMFFLNRSAHNSNDIVVTGCLMANYAKAGLSSLAFSMTNTVGNLSVVFSSTLIGWWLDYTAQSRFGWCVIFVVMGVGQWIGNLAFITLIDSDPVKFKNKRKATDNPEDQTTTTTTTATITASKGRPLNNFENLKNLEASSNVEGTLNESRQI